jgi:hypothetical protein
MTAAGFPVLRRVLTDVQLVELDFLDKTNLDNALLDTAGKLYSSADILCVGILIDEWRRSAVVLDIKENQHD